MNELQHRTGEMVDYEGIEDTIIQNVILIMRDLNEMIDINNQDQTMEWSFDWNCINKRYIYVSLTKPIIKIMDRSSGSLANRYYSSILGRKNSRSP